MRTHTRAVALLGALALLAALAVVGTSSLAADKPMKELMGDNFRTVQVMLYELITTHYDQLPKQIDTIHDHAVYLGGNPPATVKTDAERRMFINYAYQLESNTANMLVVLKTLKDHDKDQAQPGQLNIDYLRVVAARQFGDIVTSCVLCHNQFRRRQVN